MARSRRTKVSSKRTNINTKKTIKKVSRRTSKRAASAPVAKTKKVTVKAKTAKTSAKKSAVKAVKTSVKKTTKKAASTKGKQLADEVTFKHGAIIKNRMVQSSMLTNSGNKGEVTDDTLAYWRARSDSAGLMIGESSYVSENGGPAQTWADNRTQLAIYDDRFVAGLKKLAKVMKSQGNKAILQLTHAGDKANYRAHLGLPVYGPTTANYDFLPYGVQGFTTEQIDQVVKDFGTAVKRVIEAGFDGVEINGGDHYLIQQFFSHTFNKRSDKYGKADAFALAVVSEVTRVVKKYAPKDFIVGYCLSPEKIDSDETGYTWHDSTKLVKELTHKFDLDYIRLSMFSYKAKPKDSAKTFAKLFRASLAKNVKLIIVGNVMTAKDAKEALKDADLVAVGRAQLIDANFAKKVVSGHGRIIHQMSYEEEIEQKLTPGLREIFNQKEKMPNWKPRIFDNLDYSNAVKVYPF